MRLRLCAVNSGNSDSRLDQLSMNQPVKLDNDTRSRWTEYISDAFVRDGQVFKKSDEIENIAFGLSVKDRVHRRQRRRYGCFPRRALIVGGDNLSYQFQDPTSAKELISAVTGLEVSHEPGQWLVWAGCLLMGVGLVVAFYMVHMRIWIAAVPIQRQAGACGSAASQQEPRSLRAEVRTKSLNEIRTELRTAPATARSAQQPKNNASLTWRAAK